MWLNVRTDLLGGEERARGHRVPKDGAIPP